MMIFGSFLVISRLWDFIEACGFCAGDTYDLPDCFIPPHHKFSKPNITQPLQNSDFWPFLVISQLSKSPVIIL